MKILIVDDMSEDRQLLRYIAERQGHEVLEAENGQEALSAVASQRPDLIISDALMPVMDGFQFLRRLKADEALQSILFIFYSATYRGEKDFALARSLGADAYIVKPKEPKEFWKEVEVVLRDRGKKVVPPQLVEADEEYLKRYSEIVAAKLEEKVRELEEAKVRIEESAASLRKSEEFIRKILETVDEGFVVVDRNYQILSANRAFCKSAGMSESEVVGKLCHLISHRCTEPCFEAQEKCPVKHTLETGETCSVAHTHVTKDGVKCYVEIKSYPICDAAGNVVSAIETVNDVTEKKKLEEQLRHAQKLEALGTLAGGVAHDFNNILNVIVGYGDMLADRMAKDEPAMSDLREILAAAERATHLTRSLLIFSRKQLAEFKPVEINELVCGMKKMVLRLLGEDIETSITCSPEHLTVMGDYGQLEQVVMNFATNARDAMPDGGLLTIETKKIDIDENHVLSDGIAKPGRYALISVADTGKGMDEKIRERIFEPFFTTKEAGKGTGLGLAIVYGIVQQHHGHVSCHSEINKGTTFTVYLPLVEEELLEGTETDPSAIQGGTETILVADDEASIRHLTKKLLAQHGYTVIEAKNGAEAVSAFLANKDKVALLLLDVIMPGKSGKEAFEEIRAICPGIKALFISGYMDEVLMRKRILEDGLDLLQKPVKTRELLAKIRKMLDG